MRCDVPLHLLSRPVAPVELTPLPRANAIAASGYRLGFVLFLLLNLVLFVRPGEIFPSLLGLPIYEVVILGCLLASLIGVLRQLSWRSLSQHPMRLCVLGLLPAIALSHASHGNLWSARMGAADFGKILLYYLLLLAVVNSQARLRVFLITVSLMVLGVSILALLQYHGYIDLEALASLERKDILDENGEPRILMQLQASGIFNDPNDLSLVLVTAMLILLHCCVETKRLWRRIACLAPVPVLGYAFALTHSRGGFLALVAGATTYIIARRGWRRSLPVIVVAIPVMLWLFAGRQTSINLTDQHDTAQGRILLWRDGLVLFKNSPFFGIGYLMYPEEVGHVAHNTFVNSYTELGFFGGTLMLAAIYLPYRTLRRFGRNDVSGNELGLSRWRPCLLALVVGYGVGICSLSRAYVIPTYMIVGIVAAYCALAAALKPQTAAAAEEPVSFALGRRVVLLSVAAVFSIHLFVRVFAR